jgi:predicted GNAT family acetyltransferase
MAAQSSDVTRIPCPEGLSILRAEPGDCSRLFPLQFEYEREEVILDGAFHNPETTMACLRQSLTTQTTLYARCDGTPVAKAGTNAKGFTCQQLGGIYTLPEYRSRGIASALVSRLCSLIAFEAPTVSLFVKTQNAAAIAVYRRLGFKNIDRFRISYYR